MLGGAFKKAKKGRGIKVRFETRLKADDTRGDSGPNGDRGKRGSEALEKGVEEASLCSHTTRQQLFGEAFNAAGGRYRACAACGAWERVQ